ncbi:hypothetical protein Mapa_013558 [Marchantia paleacea]|nr:hypothetical protein Mapa_013558 [Marchantia paleacea]
MAYEVARVHGLIRSHIQEGEKEGPAEAWPLPSAAPRFKHQMPRLSPDTPFLHDFPLELNQWSESSHSSSLGSSTETETESDEEEDFIAGLAEQIAHSMLDEEEVVPVTDATNPMAGVMSSGIPVFPSGVNATSQKAAVSPQSSWSTNSWSASWSESVSSSKQSSEVSSPPSTPSTSKTDAWELLNEAAGEVGRLKMIEDRKPNSYLAKQSKQAAGSVVNDPRQFVPSLQPPTYNCWKQPNQTVQPLLSSPVCNVVAPLATPVVSKDRMPTGAPANVNRSWTRPRDEDRKAANTVQAQHRLSRNEGAGWNQRQSRPNHPHKGAQQKAGRQNHNFGGHPRIGGKSMEWNGGQQWAGGQGVNGGSGMRAVFLGSAGSGRESGGTGVFLPRCIGGASDHRRKPACSTVLLPSRIVQVLNLNVEDMRSHPTPLPAAAVHSRSEYARVHPPHMYMMELTSGAPKPEVGVLPTYPRKFQSSQVRQPSDLSAEFSLPTEWTY